MNLRLHIFVGQFLWLITALNGKTIHGVPGYGRNLIIKSLPAVEDIQSNVYEVFMEPYLYALGQRQAYEPDSDHPEKHIDLGFEAILHVPYHDPTSIVAKEIRDKVVRDRPPCLNYY